MYESLNIDNRKHSLGSVMSIRKFPDNYYSLSKEEQKLIDDEYFNDLELIKTYPNYISKHFYYFKEIHFDEKEFGVGIEAKNENKLYDKFIKTLKKESIKFDDGSHNSLINNSKIIKIPPKEIKIDKATKKEIRLKEKEDAKYALKLNKWISEAKKNNDDKYDYSLVELKGSLEKIDVICPIHGIFSIRAGIHKKGCGCRKCAKIEKKLLSEKIFSPDEKDNFSDNEFDEILNMFNK